MKKYSLLLVLVFAFTASCSPAEPPASVTVPASPTSLPSETPAATFTHRPPTPTPTPVPIEGTLTIKVNVRSGPGTSFATLGLLNAGEKVRIISKDSLGTWYQILYTPAPQGRAWVAAQYVQVAAGVEIPLDATATPAGPTGVVTQRLNVRSGPGTTFDTLGMLQPDAVVSLTGKNATAAWFQIDYATGPGEHGWITAQYVRTEAAANLPVLDDYGTPVAPGAAGTPSGPPMTPTPTIGMAFPDRDSRSAPAISMTFSAAGTDQFTYSSQVSVPEGDLEDWVEFTPYAVTGTEAKLTFSLTCTGNDTLLVELWQGGSALGGWGALSCSDIEVAVTLPAGQPYELRLTPAPGEGLRLVDYVLRVQNKP